MIASSAGGDGGAHGGTAYCWKGLMNPGRPPKMDSLAKSTEAGGDGGKILGRVVKLEQRMIKLLSCGMVIRF